MTGFAPTASSPTGAAPSAGGGGGVTYSLNLAVGSFAVSGVADHLAYDRHFPLTAGAFVLTGDGNTGTPEYELSAAAGAFTLTGVADSFSRPVRGLGLSAGAFSYAIFASVGYQRIMTNAAGAFVMTGDPEAFFNGFSITLIPGSFNLIGDAVSFERNPVLDLSPAAFHYSGGAFGLKAYRRFSETAGSFALSGDAAGLEPAYAVHLAPGAFALSGLADTLHVNRKLAEVAGTYVLTGDAVAIHATHGFTLRGGNFNLLPDQNGHLARNRKLVLVPGSFAMSGVGAEPGASVKLDTLPGSFALTGDANGMHAVRRLSEAPGAFVLVGDGSTGARKYPPLAASAGAFALTGDAVTFSRPRRGLVEMPGSFRLFGFGNEIVNSGDYGGLGTGLRWIIASSISSAAGISLDDVEGSPLVAVPPTTFVVDGPTGPAGPPGPAGGEVQKYTINNASSFTANHGLSYFPSVWIVDQQGNEVYTDISYANGQVTAIFPGPFSGYLYLE